MDVAALALKIDSSDLVRASAELDKFSTAASKAGATAGRAANDGAEKMSRGMSRSAQNAVTAAASVDRYAGATSGAAASAVQAAQAAMRSAQAASSSGAAARASTSGWDMLTGSLNSNFVAINKNLQALNLVPAAAARSRAALNDNVSAMQATPGNIAAQFQDIGVTAAMGMNPLLIALQQGTQLSAAFAGGGLKSLGAAFRELASPAALLTIGIVGLVAALIQMVDWTALAQSALYGLANILVDIAPYAVAAAAALALIYAPAIMTGIITLTKIIYGLAAGLLAVIPIPVLIVAGLTAIVAAAVHFRDELTQYFGFDIVQTAQDGVNHIVGVFVGGYNGIRQAWGQLPAALGDIAIRAANATLRAVENMVNGTISLINGLTSQLPFGLGKSLNIGDVSFGQIDNPFAGAEASFNGIVTGAIAAAQQVDWVGRGVAAVRDLAAQAANKLREWAKALGASDEKKKNGGKTDAERLVDILRDAEAEIAVEQNRLKAVGMSARAAAELEQRTKILNQVKKAGIPITAALRTEIDRLSKAYADAKIAADTAKAIQGVTDDLAEQKRAIADEIALIGVYGDALSRARREQDLLNAARDALPRGETLSPAVEQAIKAGAGEISDAETRRDELQRMADLKKDAEDAAYALELERGALGLTGAAAIKYAFIAERLNEAKREGIELSPQEVAAIQAAGAAYAQQRYAIDQAADAIADAREVTRGFFSDWINGVREGGNLFKQFADSVVNSLNRIIDKLLDRTLDGFLDNLFAGGLGFLGGGSSGSELGGAVMNLSSARPNALGGAYGPGGIERFAKGGAFTNSIVSTPTLFRFANGAALGEMGEAGPEAIMPLKRGPNGALGVQAHGGGSRRAEININNEYRIEGAVTPDMILAMIKQGGDATYDQVKRDLQALLQEWDTGGAVAT
ncbi:phage tail length tape measure family protein [Pelagerythrobacter marinus]|uniref:phage tail length tape measure family protein n=1 Tax=Pelagerythrobacter marinus TaxID=538382 RepID=UPI002AC8DFF7|nr:phage tail length tape measure family protein [Pelagerythrobacter marinus]WPZ05668.1 phage tail length tape measure family protein [Pelagerythrobacter marinus]